MSRARLENALTFAAHLSSAELIFLFAFSLHHLPAFVLFFIFFGPGEKAVFPPGAPLGKQDGSRSSFYGNGFERINTRGVTQTASVDGSSWPHEVEARGYIFYT